MSPPRKQLHLAMSEAVSTEVQRLLFPTPARFPEHGAIGLVLTSSGRRRRTLLLHSVVEPQEGDVEWRRGGLFFSPAYKSRALDAAAALPGAGLLFVHTHPGSSRSPLPPGPSSPDLKADALDLFHMGQALPPGVPLVAAVLASNGLWSVREHWFEFPTTAQEARALKGRVPLAHLQYASAVRVVGEALRLLPTGDEEGGLPPGWEHATAGAEQAQDSSIRLWGTEGQARLARLRVGLTGLGGVGGILSEHLARLGVGGLVMLDFDRIHEDNRNRSQGATQEDARERTLKVEVARRLAEAATSLRNFTVEAFRRSVVETDSLEELLDCDIILNGADSAWARRLLDKLAYAHLIPVINGGTDLKGNPATQTLVAGKSEVTASGPHHPCMECSGTYTRADVTEAQTHPELRGRRHYVNAGQGNEPPPPALRAPSVISNNALVAALMQLRLQAMAVGTTPEARVGTQRYHATEGVLDWAVTRKCKPDCTMAEVTALGDTCELPHGEDLDFALQRERERNAQAAIAAPAAAAHGPSEGPLRAAWHWLLKWLPV